MYFYGLISSQRPTQPTLHYPLATMLLTAYSRVQPHTALIATDQVPIYTPGWREVQLVLTSCPRMLSSTVERAWSRTHEPWIVS